MQLSKGPDVVMNDHPTFFCVQVAALCLQAEQSKGVCIINTPLISLANDQVSTSLVALYEEGCCSVV